MKFGIKLEIEMELKALGLFLNSLCRGWVRAQSGSGMKRLFAINYLKHIILKQSYLKLKY